MQEPRRQPSSYFSFSPKRRQSNASLSPVSPGASIGRPSPPSRNSLSLRRSSATQSGSGNSSIPIRPAARVQVQTIEEVAASSTRALDNVQEASSPRVSRRSPHLRISLSRSAKSAPASRDSPPSRPPSTPDQTDAASVRQASTTEPSQRPRAGHAWARTTSGGVWYQRLQHSSSQSSRPSREVGAAKRLITPLTPPTPPPVNRFPSDHHQVKVEKSFTALNGASTAMKEKPSIGTPPTESRRSSLNPLRLFSAPFLLVRKFSVSKRQKEPHTERKISPVKSPVVRGAPMRGHKSLLKRTYTSEALRQVTSLLHEVAPQSGGCSPVTVMQPVRQMSDRSSSSKGSKQQTFRHKPTKGLFPSGGGLSRRSTQDLMLDPIHSYSTSQLEFRMGAQPANTPDENATYRIKRRPSAESEEFLKVDISIRGGTSYLPSEARRIHTPPLPNEGPDGKRRGFFFDYTAPSSVQSRHASRSVPPRLELPAEITAVPRRSTSKASTITKFSYSPRKRRTSSRIRPSKTCDWYDVKLAELDTWEDESGRHSPQGRERSATTRSWASLLGVQKKKEDEKCDTNIPEHLPNSPLCPRHPRYWRVVQGRGSQFRGCWMHGLGVYGEGELKVAGVAVT